MKTALVSLNVSYIHKNLALRWLMVTKPHHHEAMIFEGICKTPLSLLDDILLYEPDVVAISIYIFNIDASIRLIKAIKEKRPTLKIVAGGPEATYHPEPLWECGIDGIFKGETELVFWDQLEGKTTQGYQSDPHEKTEILKVDLKRLEEYPSPYFLPEDQKDMGQRYLYVETSRGCPYGCTYCMASLDRQVRLFSESYLEDFFKQLQNSKVKQVKFLDRTFNISKTRALKIAHQCLAMPEVMSFHVELVGDTLDEELIQFFVTQGQDRFRMEIGVQSLNPKTLKAVSRVSNLPKLLNLIDLFSSHHLKQHVDLIAGLPFEDLTSFKQSFQGLIKLKPHEIQVGILKLLYGSELKEKAQEYGYTASKYASYQITQSHWMSYKDIREVEAVALATEKTYNTQKLNQELDLVFQDEQLIAFDVMRTIGTLIKDLSHPYTNQALYHAVYQGLSQHIDPVRARKLINHAYYKNSTLCPPALFPYSFDKMRINKIKENLNLGHEVKHLILIDRIDGLQGHTCFIYGSKGTSLIKKDYHETLSRNPQSK
ncbi:MAG: Radical SAM domain protein [Erysipelotrichaceae bacterium]|nr:MAG: Radical SAM domain protein [Erysipelotrichaceae bacterium]